MRVGDATVYRNFLRGFEAATEKISRAMNSLADGKRVRVGSDDPVAAHASLGLRARLVRLEGFRRAAGSARAGLLAMDQALGEAVEILSSAQLEAMAGGSNLGGDDIRAARVEQLRDRLLQLANLEQGGRYLFGGTETSSAPFLADGTYVGDDSETQVPLDSTETVGGTMSGRRVFLEGGDLFRRLEDLATALRNGDTPAIQAATVALRADIRRLATTRGEIGDRLQRIESAVGRHEDEALRLRGLVRDLEDASLDEVATVLSASEASRSALAATASRILGRSLFDRLG